MAGDHKCPVCQATFTRPQHVARHMRSHTGDRPYKCQHCGDQFARSDLLSRHINKCHASEKPPVTTAPNQRRKAAACRATTSKQACDQCVQGTLPCDGANPCSKCIQRKTRCTYIKFHRQTAPAGPGHAPPRIPGAGASPTVPNLPMGMSLPGMPLGVPHLPDFAFSAAPPAGGLYAQNASIHNPPPQAYAQQQHARAYSDDAFVLHPPAPGQQQHYGVPPAYPSAQQEQYARGDFGPQSEYASGGGRGGEQFGARGEFGGRGGEPFGGREFGGGHAASHGNEQFVFPAQYAALPPAGAQEGVHARRMDLDGRVGSSSPTPSLTMSGSTRNSVEYDGAEQAQGQPPASDAGDLRLRMQAEMMRRQMMQQHVQAMAAAQRGDARYDAPQLPGQAWAKNPYTYDPDGEDPAFEGIFDSDHSASTSESGGAPGPFWHGHGSGAHSRNASTASSTSSRSLGHAQHLRGGDGDARRGEREGSAESVGALPNGDGQRSPGSHEFSSAFGLMSLDDPAVLAGLSSDGAPFFSGMTPGAFNMKTPMPNADKEKNGPFAGLFSPFNMKTPNLGSFRWGDGKTPSSSREAETKELKDFWKQYLKTPLSGGGPLGMPSEGPATRPGGLKRGLSRVASLPSVRTPALEHGPVQPPQTPGGILAASQQGRTHHADDLRSYEQAVLARKAPMTLNIAPRRARVVSPLNDDGGKEGGSRPSSSLAGAMGMGVMGPPTLPASGEEGRPSFKRNASQTLGPDNAKRTMFNYQQEEEEAEAGGMEGERERRVIAPLPRTAAVA